MDNSAPLHTPVFAHNRILVVDDDNRIRDIMEKILTKAGYLVKTACDGESGWTSLQLDSFDVVLTDHEMPRLSGLDLLRRLRHDGHDVPVILASGNMPLWEADLPRLIQPGTLLQKPFSVAELLAVVCQAFSLAVKIDASRGRPA